MILGVVFGFKWVLNQHAMWVSFRQILFLLLFFSFFFFKKLPFLSQIPEKEGKDKREIQTGILDDSGEWLEVKKETCTGFSSHQLHCQHRFSEKQDMNVTSKWFPVFGFGFLQHLWACENISDRLENLLCCLKALLSFGFSFLLVWGNYLSFTFFTTVGMDCADVVKQIIEPYFHPRWRPWICVNLMWKSPLSTIF